MSRRRDANAAREAVIDKLRQEGLEAAYKRATKLLNDDGVPATAHAQLVRVIFSAGGLLNHTPEDAGELEAHQMTHDELTLAIAQHRAALARLDADDVDGNDASA